MTSRISKVSQALLACAFILPLTAARGSSDLPAPPQSQQEVIDRFKAADKNGDGRVTREEAQQGLPRIAAVWDKVDVDNKGYITLEQLLIISAANQ